MTCEAIVYDGIGRGRFLLGYSMLTIGVTNHYFAIVFGQGLDEIDELAAMRAYDRVFAQI